MHLPNPPEPLHFIGGHGVHTETQLREYGKACAEAMREACAQLVERDIAQGNPLTAYQVQYNATVLHTAKAIRALEIKE